ncbi:hypothetical protein ACFQ07_02660 [Actinomadura adrarensis]|uniref:DMT family transporter n=1 Tax=Actinomadura adrarensis TaxID=1819600 RepID=A0ABW3C9H7_9ACTN
MAKGYLLVAVGVTGNVGPLTTAFVSLLFALPVHWCTYRPLRSGWSIWRSALIRGIAQGVNHMAFQFVLRWVRLQVMQPLLFLVSSGFMIAPDAVRDTRKKTRNSTAFWPMLSMLGTWALWPILALLGIWLLVSDADGGEGGVFSEAVPEVHVLGQEIPVWALGVGALIITSTTYAYLHRNLEALKPDLKGPVASVGMVYAVAILAVGAWATEGGWGGMTGGNWSYLLICAATGVIGGYLSGVQTVKAYEQRLRASTTAMLEPLSTMAGILLGMFVEKAAPTSLGVVGIVIIFIASCGAAKYQSQSRPDSE